MNYFRPMPWDAAYYIPIETMKQHTADMQCVDSMATVKQHTADMQCYGSSATVKQHTADMQRVDPFVTAFCFVFLQAGLLDTQVLLV
ncbi:MAG: hypothetical protein JXB30_07070 [Anaerolineae bacterium]|nr:hypothetical protein [Anaerolineae bacterium]